MENSLNKKGFVVGIILLFLALVLISPSQNDAMAAEKKVFNWKFSSHTTPGSKSLAPCQIWWADQVEKRSNGQIKIKMYWVDELCGYVAQLNSPVFA
jgi:TRAP-type C4-dicarboxylate transport system substrate-binding protein